MQVVVSDDCIGNKVEEKVRALQPGQVLLLENTRFYKGEEKNDPTFSKQVGVPLMLAPCVLVSRQ